MCSWETDFFLILCYISDCAARLQQGSFALHREDSNPKYFTHENEATACEPILEIFNSKSTQAS